VVLGIRNKAEEDRTAFDRQLSEVTRYLATSRPTAVNLFWALDRMKNCSAANSKHSPNDMTEKLLREAQLIESEVREMCAAIGRHGAELLSDGQGVLTHCIAGGLATAGDGTALSVMFAAAAPGKQIHVYADETRPLLQGARLTTWDLQQRHIPVTLSC
jgi:methylthioribose-1-phosphate isomerase